jgi:hypothetical protein
MDFLNIKTETDEEFANIAQTLFDNYAIKTQNTIFRFVEIEFYWQSINHSDGSTYERKYVNPKTGDWFFHYSGVDIALRNDEVKGYGGVLIRSIIDVNTKVIYKGPMICSMKLFSETNAFEESIKTQIIKYDPIISKLIKSERIGLGQNAKKDGSYKLNYRFFLAK